MKARYTIIIFVLSLFFYTLTNYGGIRSPDSEVVYRVAESFASDLSFQVAKGLETLPGFGISRGKDGKLYAVFGPGQSILCAALIKLAKVLDELGLYKVNHGHPRLSHYYPRIIPQIDKEKYVLRLKHLIWCPKSSEVEGNRMHGSGAEQKETISPEFDRHIMIDFQGAKITSDTGLLLLREIDERFGILGPMGTELEDTRSWVHSKHSLLQMVRQRIYQVAAGYEDCNDADFLRIDPALRLAIGKGDEAGAGQSRLSRLENEVLGTEAGLRLWKIH